MSKKPSAPREAPDRLRVGSGAHELSVARVPGLVAVHGLGPDAPTTGAVLTLAGDEIAVFPEGKAPAAVPEGATIGPVYRLQPGGSLGVPTGRVFIRFADSVTPGARGDELSRAGYEIEAVPSYAPNAAWLRHRSGRIEDALQGLDALRGIPQVEHVEPQLSTERHHKA